MASFQARTGCEWPRKREKKSSRSDQFLPDLECRIPKIFAKKKFNKLKNIYMASFQAKTGRHRMRMRGKKKFWFRSVPT